METAVSALKLRKLAGVDSIPGELVKAGGDAMINFLTLACNRRDLIHGCNSLAAVSISSP